jgi:hypothetical protein
MSTLRRVDPGHGSVWTERGRVPILPRRGALAQSDLDEGRMEERTLQHMTKGSRLPETRRIGPADEDRLRILIERMVREGRCDDAIAKAVREAMLS